MPGAIRPKKEMAKILYTLLKTPKKLQQKNTPNASERQKFEWFRDSSTAQ